MTLEQRVRPAANEAAGAIVLMHGRGADEHDLFPLFDMLDPERRLVGLCPRGPLSLPPGGAHWYRVMRVGYPDPDTFLPTYGSLSEWVDAALAEHGVTIERTILGGFSQGAVMSYALALGPGRERPAGLAAFSGFIPTVEGFEAHMGRARDLPVAIGHGAYDPVIEVGFGRQAKKMLEEAGADVVYRESPMPHSIDPGYVRELTEWVGRVIE
jgi:phospholipase/carboxylesterase